MTRNLNNNSDVVLQLYELAGGMRFICDALQDGPSELLGLLRLVGERIEDCAARLDDAHLHVRE
ncbi:hypothetical protein N1030_07070 [Desulfovibrio mangrovi]|uniref:hypothetical protein n=1 Tax=Desulfovibrio mangrovi TaxID=2976983 RepID=UPI0022485E6C|nr:hypothetical protein [Desulfovibrio mangrovi]UZP68724.1 hypothetical protein N1030_07070 [Desulfovibrio mangrovi]